MLNPKSYDGARVLEASGRPMLVIGRSYCVETIQDVRAETGAAQLAEETTEQVETEAVGGTTKLTDETILLVTIGILLGTTEGAARVAGTKLIA